MKTPDKENTFLDNVRRFPERVNGVIFDATVIAGIVGEVLASTIHKGVDLLHPKLNTPKTTRS
jgi:hypothetical protein